MAKTEVARKGAVDKIPLTQERLKELLHYNPETGVFTWAQKLGSRARVGAIAGTLHLRGGRVVRLDGTLHRATRLAWLYAYGETPRRIGHENGIQDDDRIANLFDADKRIFAPLTQSRLKDLLDYNPETGEFWWRRSGPGRNENKPAGCLDHHGHRLIRIDDALYRAGRLAWFYVTGSFPEEIDHKNRIRDDDRLCNLREASRIGNVRNRGTNKNNTSGCKGVYWSKQAKKWHARITVDYKEVHIGFFDDLAEARTAIEKARKRFHGDFACST